MAPRPRHIWTVSEPWYDPGSTSAPIEAIRAEMRDAVADLDRQMKLEAADHPEVKAKPHPNQETERRNRRLDYELYRSQWMQTGELKYLIAMKDHVSLDDDDLYDRQPA